MAVAKTETQAVHLLWSQGFFKAGRTFEEIKKELSRQGYHFPDNRLSTALARANYLTKLGKRGSYRFIQKYPYPKEEEKHG
jgi:hypothetical protein